MKKNAVITVIAILAVAAVALGALYVTNNSSKTKEIETLTADVAAKTGEIETLTADVAAKAGEIETLTADVAAKDGEIETLTADVAAKAGEIETLTADVAAKAGEIETLTADVGTRTAEIEALTVDAAEKAALIESDQAAIAEKDTKIAEQEQAIADRDQKITEQEKAIEDKDRKIADQEKEIADRDALIEEQNGLIAKKELKISELETVSADLQGEVDSLTAEIAEKNGIIKALNEEKAEPAPDIPAEPENLPAEEPGEPLVYLDGGISMTLPASITTELEDDENGRRLYSDSPFAPAQKNVFIAWKIDLGFDTASLGDAMMDILLESVREEVVKMEEVSNPKFESTTILGNQALNFEFLMNVDGEYAPAYGTMMPRGQDVFIFFYASLVSSAEEVKADMLQSIGTITGSADAQTDPDGGKADFTLRFGMSRDEIMAALGPWDEEDTLTDQYGVVRYRNQPFRGHDGVLAVVTSDEGLHMWLYGIEDEGQAFEALGNEFSAEYTAYEGSEGEVTEVFGALGMPMNEAQMKAAVSMGLAEYKLWKADGQTRVILLKVNAGSVLTVVAYARAN